MNDRQNQSNTVFTYAYSARKNREVQAIRDKYMPKPENKLEQLRRLDHSVKRISSTVALTVGMSACLMFGVSLCTV